MLGTYFLTEVKMQKLTLKIFQDIAQKHGGKCLSKEYIDSKTKLNFECSKGHQFSVRPAHMKCYNTWCRECGQIKGRPLRGVKEVQKLVESKGGKLLDLEYKGEKVPLKLECKKGHVFYLRYGTIRYRNDWCPVCRKNKKLEKVKKIAKEKGFELVSKKYITSRKDLEFKCSKGHVILCASANLNNKLICVICNRDKKKKVLLDEIKILLESINYKLLSNKYNSSYDELSICCKHGHEFKALCHMLKHKIKEGKTNLCKYCNKLKKGKNNDNI